MSPSSRKIRSAAPEDRSPFFAHGGQALDYDWAVSGSDLITANQPFLVAIPTTAGTGSEVGRSSVVTDPKTQSKRTVFSGHMMPPLVLADPQLTVGLPASVTANTGLDALTHAVEAYLTPGFHPLADGIALRAIGMVGGALRRAGFVIDMSKAGTIAAD